MTENSNEDNKKELQSNKAKSFSKLYSESNIADSEIRKKLAAKDYTISRETKKLQEKEEKDLREFFSELQAPVKEDPTLVRNIEIKKRAKLFN